MIKSVYAGQTGRSQALVPILITFLWLAPLQSQQLNQKAEYGGLDVAGWRARMLEYEVYSTLPPPSFPLTQKPDPKAIPVLMALLLDQDSYIRCFLLSCLGVLQEKAEPAIAAIAQTLEDHETMVRYAAAVTLAEIGKPAKPAARKLLSLLESDEQTLRFAYAVALLSMGEGEERAAKVVLMSIKRWRNRIGHFFLISSGLAILGPKAPSSQFILRIFQEIVGNRDNRSMLRAEALESLGKARKPTKEITHLVEQSLRDDSPWVRVEACGTHWLLHRNSEVVLPVLLEILKRPMKDDSSKLPAVDLLQSMGKPALPAILDLERVAKSDPRETVREAAKNAIREIRAARP